jgi:hypothetical protein
LFGEIIAGVGNVGYRRRVKIGRTKLDSKSQAVEEKGNVDEDGVI